MPAFGLHDAVFIAALIVPLLWFGGLMVLVAALAELFIGHARANIACVMVLFAPLLLFDYTPGHVDHHGAQAIIAGFGLLGLGKIIRNNSGDKAHLYAVLCAATFACGFWIGAEALPWAILFIACLGIAAAWQGGATSKNAALFGLCLPLFTGTLIPVALPPADYASRALSWFSPAYVLFAALSGGILIIGWALGRHTGNRFLRVMLYAALAGASGTAFFALVPSALSGPFADYDTFDATTALDNITEATPLSHALHINRYIPLSFLSAAIAFFRLIALPLAGLACCFVMACRANDRMRLAYLANAVFLGTATALTLFWQMRVGIFMELFALAPLTALLYAGWDWLRWGLWDRTLFWAEIGLFLLLGPLPVVLLPDAVAKTPLYPDIVLFPATRGPASCARDPVLPVLNDPQGPGAKPQTIMNVSDIGPELLYQTRHNVIAGNFDVPGNADAFAFFHATTDAPALAAARKWHAGLVLVCKNTPSLYLGRDYFTLDHARLLPGKDGLLHLTNIDAAQPLIERLIRGQIPPWLKPIEIPGGSDYLLFKIQNSDRP